MDELDVGAVVDMARDMRLRGEERWERFARGALVIAAIFGVTTLHGIWTGDDLAGLTMTIVPGLAMLGVYAYARLRVKQIVSGQRPHVVQRAVSWVLITVAIIYVSFIVAGDRHDRRADHEHAGFTPTSIRIENVELGAVPGPDGTMIPSLVPSKRRTRDDCPDRWTEVPHPSTPGRTVGYCAAKPK
jgi:hypothetical protein